MSHPSYSVTNYVFQTNLLVWIITVMQEFHIEDRGSSYIFILGRNLTIAIMAIPSNFHQALLFVYWNWKVGRALGCQSTTRAYNTYAVQQTVSGEKMVHKEGADEEDRIPKGLGTFHTSTWK